jgi:hypothetical protein
MRTSKGSKKLLSSGTALSSGTVEIQYDELGRAYIALPVPPGYKFVTKDGMPVDGWPCEELKWDGDEATLELPAEITIVKEVN